MKEHRAVKDIPAYLEPQEIYNRYIEGARVQVYSRSIERLQARDLALVTFLYTTGLRISEALAVTKDKIEFDVEGFLVIKGNRILKHRKTLVILDKAIAWPPLLMFSYNTLKMSRENTGSLRLIGCALSGS
jgi:integrase